jgi:hypothetical protein
MRFASIAVIGSVTALAIAAAPALARNTSPQKTETEDKSTSPSCHAYQMAADGTWTVLPCQEAGGHIEHRPAPKNGEEAPR